MTNEAKKQAVEEQAAEEQAKKQAAEEQAKKQAAEEQAKKIQINFLRDNYQKLKKYKDTILDKSLILEAIISIEPVIQQIKKLQNPRFFLEEEKKFLKEQEQKKQEQKKQEQKNKSKSEYDLIMEFLREDQEQVNQKSRILDLDFDDISDIIYKLEIRITEFEELLREQLDLVLEYNQMSTSKKILEQKINTIHYGITQIERYLNKKTNDIKIIIKSAVIKAKSRENLIINTAKKIGPQDLKEESSVYIEETNKLINNLINNKINQDDYLIQEPKTIEGLSIITEIENFKLQIEQILNKDQNRRRNTTIIVIIYIIFVIGITVLLTNKFGEKFVVGEVPLEDSSIPLLGIPWPIIVWSLIGSFAAMISTFNEQPIYDFQDTLKWLLTRPVQGVVLGSAFYLILTSGLFLLTGTVPTDFPAQDNQNLMSERVILVLSFLVSYSDRFGREVFELLINRYSNQMKNKKNKKNKKNNIK